MDNAGNSELEKLEKLKNVVIKALREKGKEVSPAIALDLAKQGRRLVTLHLRKHNVRASNVVRQLHRFAKQIAKSTKSLELMGQEGLRALLSVPYSAPTAPPSDDLDLTSAIKLFWLLSSSADEAAKALEADPEFARSQGGGPTQDRRLALLIVLLGEYFQRCTGFPVTHSKSIETGFATSPFDWFVKEAISLYAPDDYEVKPRALEEATRKAVGGMRLVDDDPTFPSISED